MSKTVQARVLVTGFGPFLDITTNPSWEIARNLPSSLANDENTEIVIIVPPEPTPAAYHKIYAQTIELIQQHEPDIVIHLGLDVESNPGVFKIERSAPKDGYHNIPDIDRKVFTRAENKKAFGKSPDSLITTLDIDEAYKVWQYASAPLAMNKASPMKKTEKGKEKLKIDVQLSDDVGTYVCGFQYYVSMQAFQKEKGRRDVVFLHVPKLERQEEVRGGVKVTEELIKALVSQSN